MCCTWVWSVEVGVYSADSISAIRWLVRVLSETFRKLRNYVEMIIGSCIDRGVVQHATLEKWKWKLSTQSNLTPFWNT
jgi:hypothetical protein